ncbi:Processive diacylglycerol beta-glucosyltransferase [subsurface metagenome]
MKKKAWIIAVDMGYGHQRTAYPLRYLALQEKVINANNYQGIPKKDREMWAKAKAGYEFISAFRRTPLIGKLVFGLFDKLQRILSFYPKRDLSEPNLQLKQTLAPIKKGWGRHLIRKLSKKPLPLVATFFTAVFMAEHFNYPGEIYCVVCDTDISRTWAPLKPQKSKIKYFAPTPRVAERLKLYGVKEENIFLTGYPLPLENIGGEKMEILKKDLKYRMLNLDPQRRYFKNYQVLIEAKLGKLPQKPDHPLTIMFAVGGAGAQKEIGIRIVKALAKKIEAGEVKVVLVAGIREKVRDYFLKNIKDLDVEIIFAKDIVTCFQKFNQALRKTDILWTKPSELSFYSALGMPIIIAPPIGSQEEFNKRWLLNSGFGVLQRNPSFINQWLFDWLERGHLADAAMQGFIEGNKLGTLNIEKICCG